VAKTHRGLGNFGSVITVNCIGAAKLLAPSPLISTSHLIGRGPAMRFRLSTLILALFAAHFASPLIAQEPSLQERIAVRRDLDAAKMNLRYYWQVEYPRKCRELDAAIELTRREIDNSRALLRQYWPVTQFTIDEPFPITVRNLQMCIRTGEFRLNDLLAERNALIRYHSDQFRVLAADVYAARVRVADLEANMPPLTETPEQLPVQR
jgi:hypothetical protein